MIDFTASPYWSPTRDEHSDRTETILFWAEIAEPILAAWRKEGGVRLLDAGSGTGRLVEKLLDQGWDATGLTYQASEVAAFNQRCPDRVGRIQEADLHAIPFPDHTFDVVVCWDVLEHTMAPLHVLCELRRVTKPGGHPGELWVDCPYHIIVPNIKQALHLFVQSKWYIECMFDGSDIQKESAVYLGTNKPFTIPYDTICRKLYRGKPEP